MAMMGMVPISRRSSERPATEDGPMVVHIKRHWPSLPPEKTVSLWKETSEDFFHASFSPLCAFPAAWITWLPALSSMTKAEGTCAAFLPRAAQVNFPLWTSMQQQRLFRDYGRDKTENMPEVLLVDQAFLPCFIFASSFNLLCFQKVGAKSMQLVFSWTSLKICLLPICVEQKSLQLYGTA